MLVVREGDSPQELVAAFGVTYGLRQSAVERLLSLLENQMKEGGKEHSRPHLRSESQPHGEGESERGKGKGKEKERSKQKREREDEVNEGLR